MIQENLTIVNEIPDDENTHFVNDMCWGDGNDSADHDDSDYDPEEVNEDSDDSNDDDYNINDARAVTIDEDVEELLFIHQGSIFQNYRRKYCDEKLLKETMK